MSDNLTSLGIATTLPLWVRFRWLAVMIGSISLVLVAALRSVGLDDSPLPKVLTNSIAMKFAVIPTGEFDMGSPSEEQDGEASFREWMDKFEKPQRKVHISAFHLGVTEVTVGQFRRFVEESGHKMKPGGFVRWWNSPGFEQTDQHPVCVVSWNDAVAFCNWMCRLEGLEEFYKIQRNQVTVPDWRANGYRLPTDAEWEYACRAGTKTRFSCPEEELDRYAWHEANSGKRTHPVGEKLPNKFGLFDIHGNADEWCWDVWDVYPKGATSVMTDPCGPKPFGTVRRVSRSGTWSSPAWHARSAKRNGHLPESRSNWMGFRIARNQPQEK